jgi:hypothetical protein
MVASGVCSTNETIGAIGVLPCGIHFCAIRRTGVKRGRGAAASTRGFSAPGIALTSLDRSRIDLRRTYLPFLYSRRSMLSDVLNARYGEMRPTILIGNLTAAEMETYLGERIMDRFPETGSPIVSVTWPGYRHNPGAS